MTRATCDRSNCECHGERSPDEWAADARRRHNELRFQEIHRRLVGGQEAAKRRVAAARDLPPRERVRVLVHESLALIGNLLVEAEWRQAALLELMWAMDARACDDDDPKHDELDFAVLSIQEVLKTFARYALLGHGQDQTYSVPDERFLWTKPADLAELERRLASAAAVRRGRSETR